MHLRSFSLAVARFWMQQQNKPKKPLTITVESKDPSPSVSPVPSPSSAPTSPPTSPSVSAMGCFAFDKLVLSSLLPHSPCSRNLLTLKTVMTESFPAMLDFVVHTLHLTKKWSKERLSSLRKVLVSLEDLRNDEVSLKALNDRLVALGCSLEPMHAGSFETIVKDYPYELSFNVLVEALVLLSRVCSLEKRNISSAHFEMLSDNQGLLQQICREMIQHLQQDKSKAAADEKTYARPGYRPH